MAQVNGERVVGSGLGVEDFGEVKGADGAALSGEEALEVHEATGIVGDDEVSAGVAGVGAFDLAHGGGDHGKLGGEGAAEAAAGFDIGHFDQGEVADVAEELAWGGFDAEFAEAVAAVVERDLGGESCAQVGDPEVLDEEIGELPDFVRQGLGGLGLRPVLEELGVEGFDHGAAGTGGDDHDLCVAEGVKDGGGDGTGFVPVAGVEGGLAAAGGVLGANDAMTESFQDADHGHSDFWIQRVDEAGDEEGDGHGRGWWWKVRERMGSGTPRGVEWRPGTGRAGLA